MSELTIDGRRLEIAWHGPPPDAAPTIVLLHEGLGSVSMWKDFPQKLAAETGCGVLVYSRFGYGKSAPVTPPRPLTYMHEEGKTVLPALLDALSVREAILFGHSDGGSIAIVHAATGSPRIRALVLEAAHVFCEDVSVASIEKARDAYQHGDLRTRLSKYHDDVDGAFWGWNRAWLDPKFRDWNLEEFLPGITAPTLVIQGDADPYGTLAQVDAIARGVRGPVEKWIVPGAGHAPHKEREAETLARVGAFLRALRSASASSSG